MVSGKRDRGGQPHVETSDEIRPEGDGASRVAEPLMHDDAALGRAAVVRSAVQVRRRRGRSGLAVGLAVVCVGCVLVTHTFWGEALASASRARGKGVVQSLSQIFRGDPSVAAESKATGSTGLTWPVDAAGAAEACACR
jgi:hypothetical protein